MVETSTWRRRILEGEGNARKPRTAFRGQGLDYGARKGEAAVEEDRPPGEEVRLQHASAIAVIEWKDEEGSVLGTEPQVFHDGPGIGLQVAKGLYHPARSTCAPRGVQDQGWLIEGQDWAGECWGRTQGRVGSAVLQEQKCRHVPRGAANGLLQCARMHYPDSIQRQLGRYLTPGEDIAAPGHGLTRPGLGDDAGQNIGSPLPVHLHDGRPQEVNRKASHHRCRGIGK